MREAAALGDAWHFGIATATAAQHAAVGAVLGLRGGHTGKIAAPGGVAYLVAARAGTATQTLAELWNRYAPRVLVLIETATDAGVVIGTARRPAPAAIVAALDAFFAAAGEPALLPGFGGAAPFPVRRGPLAAADAVADLCATTTRRSGWVVVSGAATDAAQTLRYLIPYVRPRL